MKTLTYKIITWHHVTAIYLQDEDKEEMKEILEMKRTHQRIVAKRMQRDAEMKGGKLPPPPVRDYPITKNTTVAKKPNVII